MHRSYQIPGPSSAPCIMTYYNPIHHSSSVSEVSSAPPSPVSCSTTVHSRSTLGSVPRFGTPVPNRVFVGGFASNATEADLQELFSQYGSIKEIKIISDRGGVCKGYGFVTFETEEEAKRVLHEQDTFVLKERRLNIAPAVIKQQPFNRPYDVPQQAGGLLYHNGTPYTYQNGMAFFTASNPAPTPYSMGAGREPTMYSASYGPGQASQGVPSYPPIMYPAYAPQPMPYLAASQQYQYPVSNDTERGFFMQRASLAAVTLPPTPQQTPQFDYFKPLGPSPSQYIYAPHNAINGAMNALNGALSSSSQSPSPGYGQLCAQQSGQTGGVAPPGPPSGPPSNTTQGAAFFQGGNEIYYNGANHPPPLPPHQPQPQHQHMYPMEASPAHSEEWCPEPRQTGTPVVSLLKLHEAGSVEELEITRTPKKQMSQQPLYPSGPAGPRPSRSRRPAPAPQHGRGRGGSVMGSLGGQRSVSSPHLPSSPNSCLHQSTSLSSPTQVPPVYSGSRQQHAPPGQQRRGGGSVRGSGNKSGMNSRYNSYSSHNSPQYSGGHQTISGPQIASKVPENSSKTSSSAGESVNGLKMTPQTSPTCSPAPVTSLAATSSPGIKGENKLTDEGGAGDAQVVRHALPLSPPDTPQGLPQSSFDCAVNPANGGGGDDGGGIHQKMQALAL